ncbi:MAG: hypothetical protein WC069_06890 [Candidatus Shapirobacteria bacterium]
MADTNYSADDIIGATLYAKRSLKGLSVPSENATVIQTFGYGDMVGVVQSYIVHADGLYWQIDYPGGSFYVKHEPGNFSTDNIRDQGILTTREKIEKAEEQNETVLERIKVDMKKVIKTFTIVAIVVIVLIALMELNKRYHFTAKLK